MLPEWLPGQQSSGPSAFQWFLLVRSVQTPVKRTEFRTFKSKRFLFIAHYQMSLILCSANVLVELDAWLTFQVVSYNLLLVNVRRQMQ